MSLPPPPKGYESWFHSFLEQCTTRDDSDINAEIEYDNLVAENDRLKKDNDLKDKLITFYESENKECQDECDELVQEVEKLKKSLETCEKCSENYDRIIFQNAHLSHMNGNLTKKIQEITKYLIKERNAILQSPFKYHVPAFKRKLDEIDKELDKLETI